MSKNKLSSRSNHAVSLKTGPLAHSYSNYASSSPSSAFTSSRSHINPAASLSKLVLILPFLPKVVHSLPVFSNFHDRAQSLNHNDVVDSDVMSPQKFYINLITSICLVLAGGVFAGLTLGLMGQDEVYLKVIATSGEVHERQYARKVLKLIGRGKHWVLVTLLLSNVITNETLPIVLDRCLGGGWPAVVTSTASIVIFGEIIPQSICVRYGLQAGAMFSPFVLVLMYIMYPIAYPCALLLDHILGEDHGTVYKKSGLKTLVTLHKTMGVERLNQDEVTIISAVLDLKEKPVSHIMTPIDRVYTMSADAILDEKTVEEIFNAGFSRIPIHLPNEPMNFIGMLLVRVLISYDPEDALPVASFPLATLPETGADTSCLNILNYFQEGKSHMIVVSEFPGEPTGAMGVLTLEDVIEELIGEEIVDESDVYVDINKNIKRKQPGPLSKRNLTSYLHNLYQRSATSSKRNSLEYDAAALTPLRESFVAPVTGNSIHQGAATDSEQNVPKAGATDDDDVLSAPVSTPGTPAPPKATATTGTTTEGPSISATPSRLKSPAVGNGVGAAVTSPLIGGVDTTKSWKPKNPAANPLETNKTFVTIKRPNIDSVKNAVLPGPNRSAPGKAKSYGAIHATEEGAIEEAKKRNSLDKTDDDEDENDDENGAEQGHKPNGHRNHADHQHNGRVTRDYSHENHRFLLPEERETDVSEIQGEDQKKQQQKQNQNQPNGRNGSRGHGYGNHDGSSEGSDDHSSNHSKHSHHSNNGYNSALPHGIPHSEAMPVQEYQESRSYRTGGIIESVVNVQGVHKTIIEHISDDEDGGLEVDSMSNYSQSSKRSKGRSQQFDVENDIEEGQGLLSGLRKKNQSSSTSVASEESKSRFSMWK